MYLQELDLTMQQIMQCPRLRDWWGFRASVRMREQRLRTGRGGEREAQAPAKGASAVGMCGRSGSMPSGDSLHE